MGLECPPGAQPHLSTMPLPRWSRCALALLCLPCGAFTAHAGSLIKIDVATLEVSEARALALEPQTPELPSLEGAAMKDLEPVTSIAHDGATWLLARDSGKR